MILILASGSNDSSFDAVTNWLRYYNVAFLKITNQDFIDGSVKISTNVTSNTAIFQGVDLVDGVKAIWFRGFQMKLHPFDKKENTFRLSDLQVYDEVQDEYSDIVNHFFYLLKDKPWFPHFTAIKNNKITTLDQAKRCGLQIPETRIIARKAEVVNFLRQSSSGLIVKPIYFVGYYKTGKYGATAFTRSVSQAVLNVLPDEFFPCLFQQKAKSDYEIRITYIDGDCFACIWFYGSRNKQTDKKLNDLDVSNHYMPYSLPKIVQTQLKALMNMLNLKTGTIDLIKSDDLYYFLEVNPCGLFLFESVKCNLYLDKKFAECLSKYCKEDR